MLIRVLAAILILAAPVMAGEDPFAAPPELEAFVRKETSLRTGIRAKLQGILDGVFRPADQGGLGITYDNAYTRTVSEVWRDRKANCLSLTAFYIAATRSIGIQAHFAEALNTNRWRRVGQNVRFERHVVAMVSIPPGEDMVADFLPQLRRRMGLYRVAILDPVRVKALFHANRAVELMDEGKVDDALVQAQTANAVDPELSVGWNILGVVQNAMGNAAEAEASYRRALAYDPRDGAAIGNMEALMRATGRTEEAARYREMGQEVRKRDPYFHAFVAEEALAEGDLEEARRRISLAIKILPQEPEFFLILARLNLQEGRMEDALKAIAKAKKVALPAEQARYENKMTALQQQQGEKKK